MPFTQQNIQLNSISIHLLHYKDFEIATYQSHLTDEENLIFFSFKNEKRKKEYLATRFLRNELFGKVPIHYNPVGAPMIHGQGFISISHAKNVSGIAVCKDFALGLDLELVSDKAIRVASKFLSKEEQLQFDTKDAFEMSAAWSAKECLYKLAGRKEIHFNKELLLEKITNEQWKGRIVNPNEQLETKLQILRQKDLVLTINTAACERQ